MKGEIDFQSMEKFTRASFLPHLPFLFIFFFLPFEASFQRQRHKENTEYTRQVTRQETIFSLEYITEPEARSSLLFHLRNRVTRTSRKVLQKI